MSDTRTMVLTMLSDYRENQRRIDMLRYELEHCMMISEDDMIDVLTFGHGENVGPSESKITDKTFYAALNYQTKTQTVNETVRNEIILQLSTLKKQQDRLLFYIGLMNKYDAEVILMSFIDGIDNNQIAEKLGVSVRTVRSRRSRAIDHLCEMFAYMASVQPNGASM